MKPIYYFVEINFDLFNEYNFSNANIFSNILEFYFP